MCKIFFSKSNAVLSVDGHTDNIPITRTRFPSNWELSAARAAAVLRHFLNVGFDKSRLAIAGYGELRPVEPNDTQEGRAKNRRVEFVFKQGRQKKGKLFNLEDSKNDDELKEKDDDADKGDDELKEKDDNADKGDDELKEKDDNADKGDDELKEKDDNADKGDDELKEKDDNADKGDDELKEKDDDADKGDDELKEKDDDTDKKPRKNPFTQSEEEEEPTNVFSDKKPMKKDKSSGKSRGDKVNKEAPKNLFDTK